MKKFRTVYYQIGNKEEKNESLVFAHISDLHGCSYGEKQERLLKAIQKEKPDAVMASGDMIAQSREENKRTLDFFEELSKDCAVFFCNGNHETRYKSRGDKYGILYQEFQERLKKAGVFCLDNESVLWEKKGRMFRVAGYEGSLRYYGRFSRSGPDKKELETLLGKKRPGETTILLAHNPMYFPVYKEWGADLTFSGHLHGGYLRLPFVGGVITPQVQLFPKYDRGLFEEEGKFLLVSPGLGDHSISPRLFNPPELLVAFWG